MISNAFTFFTAHNVQHGSAEEWLPISAVVWKWPYIVTFWIFAYAFVIVDAFSFFLLIRLACCHEGEWSPKYVLTEPCFARPVLLFIVLLTNPCRPRGPRPVCLKNKTIFWFQKPNIFLVHFGTWNLNFDNFIIIFCNRLVHWSSMLSLVSQ